MAMWHAQVVEHLAAAAGAAALPGSRHSSFGVLAAAPPAAAQLACEQSFAAALGAAVAPVIQAAMPEPAARALAGCPPPAQLQYGWVAAECMSQ